MSENGLAIINLRSWLCWCIAVIAAGSKIKKVTYDWHFAYEAVKLPLSHHCPTPLSHLWRGCADEDDYPDMQWLMIFQWNLRSFFFRQPLRWFTEKVTSVWFTIEGEAGSAASRVSGRTAADGFVKFVGQELLLCCRGAVLCISASRWLLKIAALPHRRQLIATTAAASSWQKDLAFLQKEKPVEWLKKPDAAADWLSDDLMTPAAK